MSAGYLIIIAVSILFGFINMLSASHNIAVLCSGIALDTSTHHIAVLSLYICGLVIKFHTKY